MPSNPTSPWKKYAVKQDGILYPDCTEFGSLSHVTHIENAVNVIKLGMLVPQLVQDESKLKTRRILVNWLSPNFWNGGFRYGNVSFDFDFPELIHNKRFYWVEAIKHTSTSPTACRILITPVNRDQSQHLTIYDPQQKDGPWWWHKRANKHYRNPRYVLEFMLEEELPLDKCSAIDFVTHHPNQCAIDYRTCLEKGYSPEKGGALFIAGVLSQRFSVSPQLCGRKSRSGQLHPKGTWDLALYHLKTRFEKLQFGGSVQHGTPESVALSRALMAALFRKDGREMKALSVLFASLEDLLKAIQGLVKESFGLDSCFDV